MSLENGDEKISGGRILLQHLEERDGRLVRFLFRPVGYQIPDRPVPFLGRCLGVSRYLQGMGEVCRTPQNIGDVTERFPSERPETGGETRANLGALHPFESVVGECFERFENILGAWWAFAFPREEIGMNLGCRQLL